MFIHWDLSSADEYWSYFQVTRYLQRYEGHWKPIRLLIIREKLSETRLNTNQCSRGFYEDSAWYADMNNIIPSKASTCSNPFSCRWHLLSNWRN